MEMHMNTDKAIEKLAMAVSILDQEIYDPDKIVTEKYAGNILKHMQREDLTFGDLHLAIESIQMAISGFSKSYNIK